jgi:DNA-binding NarL/FixJ family response regulator
MRIILADHHEHPRWALKTLIEEQPDFTLVGEAVDSQGLLMLVDEQPTDLILLDRELPGRYIEDLIASLRALNPRPILVVMSSEIESGRRMLRAGADSFVSKSDQPDLLLEKLQHYAGQFDGKEAAKKNIGI